MSQPAEYNRRARAVLTVLWCSFLAASIATMVFFAYVDPASALPILRPTEAISSHTMLYSLGFFFFWSMCILASTLTTLLAHPQGNRSS